MKRIFCKSLLGAMLLFFVAGAHGATIGRIVSVTGILTDDTNFGGCMARVTPSPSTFAGVTCAAGYVTFSCTGVLTTKSDANTKLSVCPGQTGIFVGWVRADFVPALLRAINLCF